MTAMELVEELMELPPEVLNRRIVCYYGEQGWEEVEGVTTRTVNPKDFNIRPAKVDVDLDIVQIL